MSSELLRGTGWEGAGKGGYVGEQGCLRRKDGSATLFFGQLHLCETNERTTNENRRPRRNPCSNRSSETKTLNRHDSLNFSQDYLNNHDCIVTILSWRKRCIRKYTAKGCLILTVLNSIPPSLKKNDTS